MDKIITAGTVMSKETQLSRSRMVSAFNLAQRSDTPPACKGWKYFYGTPMKGDIPQHGQVFIALMSICKQDRGIFADRVCLFLGIPHSEEQRSTNELASHGMGHRWRVRGPHGLGHHPQNRYDPRGSIANPNRRYSEVQSLSRVLRQASWWWKTRRSISVGGESFYSSVPCLRSWR